MNKKLLFIRLLLLGLPLLLGISAFAQISLEKKHVPIQEVLLEIKKQSGYDIVFNANHLKNIQPATVNLKNVSLKQALERILSATDLEYSFKGKAVIIKPRSKKSEETNPTKSSDQLRLIEGQIVGESDQKLEGVIVSIGKIQTVSAVDGRFRLRLQDAPSAISFSLLGYQRLSVQIENLFSLEIGEAVKLENGFIVRVSNTQFNIALHVSNTQLKEVEVNTGMFSRNKETFTGVTRTLSGKELRAASRQNILEGLNMLDPSFKIIRDNNLGSDPNQLPKIEIRGSRSLPPPTPEQYSQQLKLKYEQDPNQPLFILDGFEADLSTIVNLDINRVASITLLKDAASTALYGSRSANGVVVVETIRPTPGALQVAYRTQATMVMPDLSGYNMMDGQELLRFQELTSIGENAPGPFAEAPDNLVLPKLKHAFRQNALLGDVHADWMEVPLQYSGALDHSVSVTGGDAYFNYNVALSKGSTVGVMKGSGNSQTSGQAILAYRKGKINISNNLTINGTRQEAGPYGSFSQYVKIPSYYAVNQSERYLEEHQTEYFNSNNSLSTNAFQFPNPLYNAQLPYKNSVKGLSIVNNIGVNWDALPYVRISAGLQYSRSNDHADYFISPLNTQFDAVESSEKGSYQYQSSQSENYSGFLTLTYNKVFAEKHIVNMNVRGDLRQATNEGLTMAAVGFAATAEPLIYLANSYTPDGKPGGNTTKKNSMALIGSLNYSYDMRYNVDLSYNLSGASNFGSDNPYQSFYAAGVSWNLDREAFLENVPWVDRLMVFANFGLTGNQNAGNFGSRGTYRLNSTPVFFGESVQLVGVGNPDLDWTKTYNLSYGLSGRFFENAVSLSLNGYRNLTDPLIIILPLPPSVGIPEGMPQNIGKLTTTGLEVIIDARLINTPIWTVNLGVNAPLWYKSEYSGLGDVLHTFNDSARNNGYIQRYYDGASPDDVWAVRSMGIGQARGYEVFLDKDGQYTYVFDKNNEVVVGSSRPVWQGNVNLSVRYKRFTLSIYSRYVLDEMKPNTALYNKVENISAADMEYNQDRRALYVRWQNPGDEASFLGISNLTQGMSSRFLQKERAVYVDGVNFNYDVFDAYSQGVTSRIREKLGLQSLTFGITTSNIFQFRLSNIKRERGLDYPFQRSATVNLNLTF